MWAIRRASVPFKSQAFSSVTFRACYAKYETAISSHMDITGFGEPPPHIYDRSLLLKGFSLRAHGDQNSFIGRHSFSSQAGAKSSGEENDDLKDAFSDCDTCGDDVPQGKNVGHESDDELISEDDISESEGEDDIALEVPQNELGLLDMDEEVVKESRRQRRASGLFKAVVDSTSMSTQEALDKWLEKGNDLTSSEISLAMFELRKRRMYGKALQLSEWLESQVNVEFGERKYASRVDLIAKIRGIHKAESYIEKIPESFRGEIVYRTLLTNCVLSTHTKKAEQVFKKMKDLKLPVTAYAYNQLLLLYKRTDKQKIADVLLLMEKDNIKPTLSTYRILIDAKGQSNDLAGMEQVLETMKAEGFEPDSRMQAVMARHYIYGGLVEKAKAVLKEMEGSGLKENRRVCSSLLPLYAQLESVDDVKRVWEVCESNPLLDECLNAIDTWGKLGKVEEAEAVFDRMSKKWKKLSAKHYTAMLKVYASNKMVSKGKDLVKQMGENGCRIGPLTWDALVKLYLEAGDVNKADSILTKAAQQVPTKPLFSTYMMVLDHYAMRGDVANAEKVFQRMRQKGYVSRFRQYRSLLQAYVNAKAPAYGFRERMKADNVFPNKSLAALLAQVDVLKKNAVSELLD